MLQWGEGVMKWRVEGVWGNQVFRRTAASLSSGEAGGAASVRWERSKVEWGAVGVQGKRGGAS